MATDKRKHDQARALSFSLAVKRRRKGEETLARTSFRLSRGSDAGRFLLIGREIYWVPVRVTYDLKPHTAAVLA